MIITQTIELDQNINAVWSFFDEIPQVAACIPGAVLTNKINDNHYDGGVVIKAGPIYAPSAVCVKVANRDDAKKVLTIDASGTDEKGRGSANALLTIALSQAPKGTKAAISLDLQISGAAAQFGRGLVSDVTAVLVNQTANSMKARLTAIAQGKDPNKVVGTAQEASGIAIALTSFRRAAARVFARFFLPYKQVPTR